MNKHNKLWFVASFIVLPLMLAACGGGSPGSIPDLSPLVDGTNEGSVSQPVPVTVGIPHPGSVAPFTGPVIGSYYTFTATQNTAATISLRDPLLILVWELFSNPNFTGIPIESCTVQILIRSSCTTTAILTNGTRYFLQVRSVNPSADRYTLLVTQP